MTLVSRFRALQDGCGELVDLSALEAQILCLTYYPVSYFEMLGGPGAVNASRPCREWPKPPTGWSPWAAAPRNNGSTCV